MELKTILSQYRNLAERNPQLNVATLKEMRDKLVKRCEKLKVYDVKSRIEEICDAPLSMRDGCEVNSETIKETINQVMAFLNYSVLYH